MSIMRWDPFADVRQAMDRVLEESFRPLRALRGVEEVTPAIDMYHTPTEVVIKASLPGIKPEDVNITISGDTLNIKGETKTEEEIKREDYLYQERRYGSFSRTIALPSSLKTDKAEATFESGVLTLTIPKMEEAKPKTIKVTPKKAIEGK
jgi:HSP20 family protein